MARDISSLERELEARGITRRDFVGFCAGIAAMLGLQRSAAAKILTALETKQKPSVVWLEFQDCAGNTESFLRASKPTAADVILDLLSLDYHETIMAAAGKRAEEALATTLSTKKGQYIVVIEGSIPIGADGAYCTIGGRSALQIARGGLQGCARGDRGRHVRRVRRAAGRGAEPDGRAQRGRRRARDQER